MIILSIIDSSNGVARSLPLHETCHRSLWLLQITITLTEVLLLIFFCNPVVKNCCFGRGYWTQNLNSSSQLDACDPSKHSLLKKFAKIWDQTLFTIMLPSRLLSLKILSKMLLFSCHDKIKTWPESFFSFA